MKKLITLSILLFLVRIAYSQNTDDLVIAKGVKINSTVLGEERTIYA
jgi:hypothetical protein